MAYISLGFFYKRFDSPLSIDSYMQPKVKFSPILLTLIGSMDSNSSKEALQGIFQEPSPTKQGFLSHHVVAATAINGYMGSVNNIQHFYNYGMIHSYFLESQLWKTVTNIEDSQVATHLR